MRWYVARQQRFGFPKEDASWSTVYAGGASEEVLGQVIRGRRDRLLVATKARFATGSGPNDAGLSRHHLIASCERSLQRLGIDHIDLYQVHQWDGQTPVEETLGALDRLVQDGKVRYIGCSNFSAWHLGKSLAAAACPSVSTRGSVSLFGAHSRAGCFPANIDAINKRPKAHVFRWAGMSRRSGIGSCYGGSSLP
jgi:aryl-alcohol dehydrogenase-like predicted oxidoreductase